jgi:hypothetical protein
MHAGFETIFKVGFGSESRYKKIISDSQHCRKQQFFSKEQKLVLQV